MTRAFTTAAVVMAPLVLFVFTALRAICLFRSIRRLSDGGERVVAPVMDRVALSIGSPSVSLILDLDDIVAGESVVAVVRRYLGQHYRNLELVLLCGSRGVPTELGLAFDLVESGTTELGTVHRSRREERLSCVVTGNSMTYRDHWRSAVAATSGELIVPIDPQWDLRRSAVAELAAPWVRRPQTAAAIGIVHKQVEGIRSGAELVAIRADLMAIAGLGNSGGVLGSFGAFASGHEGCVVGAFARGCLERIDGMPGPISSAATWIELGRRLHVDGRERTRQNRIQVVAQPMGTSHSSRRRSIASEPSRAHSPWSLLSLQLLYRTATMIPVLVLISVSAAIVGALVGLVDPNVLWVSAAVPVLHLVVIVIGLMMDDRALRPVGNTGARLQLLVAAIGAALWGTMGSPLRPTTSELNRA